MGDRNLRAALLSLAVGAVVLLLADQACPADRLDALVVASAVADIVTTEQALRSPGLVEGNPLMQSTGARVGVKALVIAGTIVAARHLERRGQRGWSRALRIVVVVVWSGAAINNAVKARGNR